MHDGIDINAKANTPVYTVADGTVVDSKWNGGYGNYIEIEHDNGLRTFYGHLNTRNVKAGDVVKQGQTIGLSGNTGIGTGPHLHFGMKRKMKGENAESLDPRKYLPEF